MLRTTLALALASALPLDGSKLTTTEPFNREKVVGGWSFGGSGPDARVRQGGNPGAWLRNQSLTTATPVLSSSGASVFTGDYRAENVTRLSIDARTLAAPAGTVGLAMTLLLRDTKGTPDPTDDDFVYSAGSAVPAAGAGWAHYDFVVPSASTIARPPGWAGGWSGDPTSFRPGVEWSDVVQAVDQVEFRWGDPAAPGPVQTWDVGVDNAEIAFDEALGVARAGSGLNPATFSQDAPAVLGGTFQARLDCSAHAPDLGFLLGYTRAAEGIFLGAGELLVDLGSTRLVGTFVAHGGGDAVFASPVPNDPALCGVPVYLQGACGGDPGLALSNGLDLVLGL